MSILTVERARDDLAGKGEEENEDEDAAEAGAEGASLKRLPAVTRALESMADAMAAALFAASLI
jgi:hypothetical protein